MQMEGARSGDYGKRFEKLQLREKQGSLDLLLNGIMRKKDVLSYRITGYAYPYGRMSLPSCITRSNYVRYR